VENVLTSKDNSNNMKKCSKCKIEKELTEFSKDRRSKDGLQNKCKFCNKEYHKKYYQANKEYRKKYYKENKEKIKKYYQANKEYRKKYYKENKEKIKKYYQANKERLKERSKKYREANKEYYKKYREANKEYEKERWKKYYKENKEKIKKYREANKEKINKYRRQKRKTDPLFKMSYNLRNRTYQAFKNKGYSKTSKTQEMSGVDWEVAKQHIEEQFTEGMNWDNQGEWHIDHIIPLASANNEADLKKLCHYSNLQPLWAEDNIKKRDKHLTKWNSSTLY
jgi:hypothetical protein